MNLNLPPRMPDDERAPLLQRVREVAAAQRLRPFVTRRAESYARDPNLAAGLMSAAALSGEGDRAFSITRTGPFEARAFGPGLPTDGALVVPMRADAQTRAHAADALAPNPYAVVRLTGQTFARRDVDGTVSFWTC